jgi:hypothetical protein
MKVSAFAGIMEQTVAGINMHLFIDPDFHRMVLAMAGYNIIMSEG